MPTQRDLLGRIELDDGLIAGDGRICTRELEAGELADAAPAAVAADEVLRAQRARARLHRHAVVVLLETFHRLAATDLDPELARSRDEDLLERLLRHGTHVALRVALKLRVDQEHS